MKTIDIEGQRFGMLAAISSAGEGWWLCRCDCGKRVRVHGHELRRGKRQSCGCTPRAIAATRTTLVGLKRVSETKTGDRASTMQNSARGRI